ncbi:MAG: leucine--tRNA ligase, partial [Treponema sp.]|nr:leucine--tRNA ligase [Treponema sp.]
GDNVIFKIDGYEGLALEIYTTRADTLFGATYMVLSPEHPLVEKITTAEQKNAVNSYLEEAAKKSDLERTDLAKEKTGVFSGAYAINPVNDKKIPIWIADYVLISYGTGAIMAVPAHDERDWDFANAFNLPIVQVVSSLPSDDQCENAEGVFTGNGWSVNSGFLNGLSTPDAIKAMTKWLEEKSLGKFAVNYKLRDWIFSRQRYWGEPIPVVHCEKCSAERGSAIVPLDEKDLPLKLPDVLSYAPTGTGESPLAAIDEWVNTSCPKCGGPARRETNTMPQWAGSCWYYLRYLDPQNPDVFAGRDKINYWAPVDLYVGGVEHAVLHLLYARFWHKVLYDFGLVNSKEPFQRLVNQGMITSFAYQRKDKTLVPTDQVEKQPGGRFTEKATGEEVAEVIAKMSKSLKNIINPDEIVRDYGADSLRVYEMFMGPLEISKPWSTAGLVGVSRFLERIWNLSEKTDETDGTVHDELTRLLHKTIKKVSNDTDTLNFNTAISAMMIYSNELAKLQHIPISLWEPLVKMLSCYAPHLGEELWERTGHKTSVSKETWPVWDENLCIESEVTIVVQVNGKIRDKFTAPAGLPKEELEKQAFALSNIQKWLDGKTVQKTITLPDKLINIVL